MDRPISFIDPAGLSGNPLFGSWLDSPAASENQAIMQEQFWREARNMEQAARQSAKEAECTATCFAKEQAKGFLIEEGGSKAVEGAFSVIPSKYAVPVALAGATFVKKIWPTLSGVSMANELVTCAEQCKKVCP